MGREYHVPCTLWHNVGTTFEQVPASECARTLAFPVSNPKGPTAYATILQPVGRTPPPLGQVRHVSKCLVLNQPQI